ncbi:MAG: DMT family transporter [Armatimonadetes bacterium]|nr:DMT family transporter [Armatimonadota bacterium]
MLLPAWVGYALLGFFGFGITNFLLGCVAQWSGGDVQASISAPILVWCAMGIAGAVAAGLFSATGRGYRGIPARRLVWVAAVAGVTLSAGMLTLKLGLASDPTARGPIVAITATNAMLVALLAYGILKEKLSAAQLAGFLVIVAGLVTIGLASGASASLRGLFYGLLTMLLFSITNYLLKHAGHRGANSLSATAILWLASGGVGVAGIVVTFLSGRGLAGLDSPGSIAASLVAGLFLALGMFGIKTAVTRGPGGPATAITGSNAILVTLLDWLYFGHWPPAQKMIGMLVALLGIVVLALGGRHAPPKRTEEGEA